jgi:ParB family chromosome partitioning protein
VIFILSKQMIKKECYMANKKPSGLGRGLGALLGDDVLKPEAAGNLYLPISQVESYSNQPRKIFDEEALAELADSIREHGIIQPLTVRKLASGYYQIIAGERRWRAARLAGLSEVPAVVVDADDKKAAELALVENLQREDLNPMEEAAGFQALMQTYHMTQEEAAQRVGKSRSAVANALRLLGLHPPVRALVEEGKLSAGHARALLPLQPALQEQAAQAIIAGGLSVRQTEALVKRMTADLEADKTPDELPPPRDVDYTAEAQRELAGKLGRGVRIVTGKKKGRVELEYYDLDDLNDLLEALALLRTHRQEKGSAL